MLDQLKEIVTRYAEINPEEIKGDTKLIEDLGLTSFALMSMMGDIEEEFGIIVTEEELVEIYTVDDVVRYITQKQGE